jgi:hypothetical protein
MSGTIPVRPYALMVCTGTNLPFFNKLLPSVATFDSSNVFYQDVFCNYLYYTHLVTLVILYNGCTFNNELVRYVAQLSFLHQPQTTFLGGNLSVL